VLIAVTAVCIALAASCAAFHYALAEASRAKLDDMLQGRKRERIDRLLQNDARLALSATICRALFATAAAVLLALGPLMQDLPACAVLGSAVALVLIVGEIAPRMIVARSPEAALARMLPAFSALSTPLAPAAAGLLALARYLRKTSKLAGDEEDEAADDILSAVTEGEKDGAIGGKQADMIENIIELRDADVAEIMTPRPDMASVAVDAPLDQTIQVALESGHSRLPVFRNTRDDIVGVLYVRDLLAARAPGADDRPLSTEQLMRPPHFVPETMRISDLLRQLQEHQTTMAIAVDEYGGTAGLVTITDIVHAIVGEVRDRDEPQREPAADVIDRNTIKADARMPVRKLNEDFGTDIPESDEYDTVGGYLCYALGRVPRPDDRHSNGGTDIVVLKADDRRVQSVKISVKGGIKQDSPRDDDE